MADAGADADGDRNANARAARSNDVVGDELAQPFAGGDRAVEGRLRQHQREFLAAQASGNIGRALLLLQYVGDSLDDVVADVMAVSVVDRLEVVDVAHQQRHRPAIAAKARPFGLGQSEKSAPVVEPGHAVDGREPLQRLGLAHQIADIAVGEKPAAVGQRLAAKTDDLAVIEPDIERAVVAGYGSIPAAWRDSRRADAARPRKRRCRGRDTSA